MKEGKQITEKRIKKERGKIREVNLLILGLQIIVVVWFCCFVYLGFFLSFCGRNDMDFCSPTGCHCLCCLF